MQEWSIAEMGNLMARGELSAEELTRMYLERIEQIDRGGPRLNAVLEVNPQALEISRALDDERRRGSVRGPLHGAPLLIKDNIDTADSMTTSSGSLALEGHHAARDAFLVERLRQAGAVLLGKTNLSEWANFRSTHSSSGWSSRGGQTRNPYALDRSPCGSSSGSGAAVAANLCAAAVGTETDGSIVCPAHANGIVGIKPTVGLVSRSGVIPISISQDTAGPMARSVADAALLLAAMSGTDARDLATVDADARGVFDYRPYLKRGGLKGARIGVARGYFGFDWRVDEVMEGCLEVMRRCGAVLVDPVELLKEDRLAPSEVQVLFYEFKVSLNAYLEGLGPEARVRSLAEVIRFNEENRARVMPYFQQERLLAAQQKGPLTSKRYLAALEKSRRLARDEGIDRAIKEHNLDALVAPTGGPSWLIDLVNGDCYGEGGFSTLAAVAGYPHLTLPAGLICGLPVGISFFASAWSEARLIELAYDFEQAAPARQPPRFLPTVAL